MNFHSEAKFMLSWLQNTVILQKEPVFWNKTDKVQIFALLFGYGYNSGKLLYLNHSDLFALQSQKCFNFFLKNKINTEKQFTQIHELL